MKSTPKLAVLIEADLAILIDADNVQRSTIDFVLHEASQRGALAVVRIYGDFTSLAMAGWKPILHDKAIHPIQQFAYSVGKNATDGAMIIDAMDLLHSGKFDGFCIVSSDSDFTSLAVRIREEGLRVYGFGRSSTLSSFKAACHEFVCTDLVNPAAASVSKSESPKAAVTPAAKPPKAAKAAKAKETKAAAVEPLSEKPPVQPSGKPGSQVDIDALLREAYMLGSTKDGCSMSELGSNLRKLMTGFDAGKFGHKKLSTLISSRGNAFALSNKGATPWIKAVAPN